MIKKAKILKDNTDPASNGRQLVLRQFQRASTEYFDGSARWAQGKQHQAQEGRFPSARRAGYKLEALGGDCEIEVTDNLRTNSVA